MRPSIYPAAREDLGVVIASQRTGSSLAGHLLHESGVGNCIGELHVIWRGWSVDFLERIQARYHAHKDRARIIENESPMIIDKIVHGKHSDSGAVPFGHASRIWCLIREPLTHLAAIDRVNWKTANFTYLLKNTSWVFSVAQMWSGFRDLRIFDYYHMFDEDHRARVFGEHMRRVTSYRPTSLAGKPGWGDPSKAIKSGTLQNRSVEGDVDAALNALPEELIQHPAVTQMYQIYNDTLAIAGLPSVPDPR